MTYMLETTFLIRSPTSKLYTEKKRFVTIFNRPTVCQKTIVDKNMGSQLCLISNLGNCTEIKPDFTTKATENPQVFPYLWLLRLTSARWGYKGTHCTEDA